MRLPVSYYRHAGANILVRRVEDKLAGRERPTPAPPAPDVELLAVPPRVPQRAAPPPPDPSGDAFPTPPASTAHGAKKAGADTAEFKTGEIREAEYQAALCRAYNDFMADWCKAAPDRLKGVAIVPYLDPTEAARELDRAVSKLGLVGLMFPTFIPGRNVAEPFFWPIYEEAERLGVPVGMHASGSETGDPYRFNNFLALHTWTHAPEQMISLISCIYGGLFEKFQRLRIGFMEAGCSWLPFWMDRMDEEWSKRKAEAPLCRKKPSDYLRSGQLFFAAEGDEKSVPEVIRRLGNDIVFYASDVPHWDHDFPDNIRELATREDLSVESKRKILYENTRRLYELTPVGSIRTGR